MIMDPLVDSEQVSELALLLSTSPRNKKWGTLKRLLRQESCTKELVEQLTSQYTSVAGDDLWMKGPLGFLLFVIYSERFAETACSQDKATANSYLHSVDDSGDKITLRFLYKQYKVPVERREYSSESLGLHRVGTTSIILQLKTRFALKIIKPRYWDNAKIIMATKLYADDHPSSNYVPQIVCCGDRYIIMDFIQGMTLREFMQSRLFLDESLVLSPAQLIDTIAPILYGLCEALKHYAQLDICHRDLNPDNIIIEDSSGTIKLIDFGLNYLLLERTGSVPSFARMQSYVAPEILQGKSNGTIKSDIYSLGIILLEMIGSHQVDTKEISFLMDEAWRRSPDIGPLFDDMLDVNPENRFFEHQDLATIYDTVRRRIETASTIYKQVYLIPLTPKEQLLTKLPIIVFGDVEKLLELRRRWVALRRLSEEYADTRRLLYWALGAEGLHLATLLIFGILFLNDLNIAHLWHSLGLFHVLGGLYVIQSLDTIKASSWYNNMPGRIIGLSFSILASRYYLNIYSTLSARSASTSVDFWMRINAVSFSLLIIPGIVVWPEHWPFISGMGLMFVYINNSLSFKAARKANEELKRYFQLPGSVAIQDFLEEYRGWGSGILWYASALVVLEVLLVVGVADDAWVYALSVSVCGNMLHLYRGAASKKAPMIRSGLGRLLTGYDRVKKKATILQTPI